MNLTYLKDIGLSDKEIQIYTVLYSQGRLTPTLISKSTGIRRPTVYSVLQELKSKGLVSEDKSSNTSAYISLPPENLLNIIAEEERKLIQRKGLVQKAVEEIQTLPKNTKQTAPKVTFIYEADILDFLHRQTPEWNRSAMRRDGVWWGFQDSTFLSKYQSWVDWYWQGQNPDELILKLLTNESDYEKRMRSRGYTKRLIKFWKNSGEFTATTWVIGDYIVMLVTDQRPCYLVQIHDELLAQNMRTLFKDIWNRD